MAKKFDPSMLLLAQAKPTPWLDMGLPADVAQMQAEQAMPAAQAATSPMSKSQLMQNSSSPNVGASTTKTSVSKGYLSPEDEARRQELISLLARQRDQSGKELQSGIDDFQNQVKEYEASPTKLNLAPISALVADITGVGGNVASFLQAQAPETPAEKRKQLTYMKQQLQGMEGSLSKDQYMYLKEELDGYNDQIKLELQEQRAAKRAADEDARTARLFGRDLDKDLMEFQKRIQPIEKVDNTLGQVEQELGLNLNEFDPSTSTVRGEKADAPGVNVPILGRLNQATPEGRRFKAALARLTNTVLKERSGAAVTESEEHRMLSEFASGKFKFNTEADLLATLKSYGDLLDSDRRDIMAGFRPKVVETYYNPQGLAAGYKRSGGANKPSAVQKRTKRIEDMTDAEMIEYEKSLMGQ